MRDPHIKKYGDVIRLWLARFDTAEIAGHLELPECLVARWVANFRDVTREKASA